MVEIVAGEAIAKATVLHQISDTVLKQTLAENKRDTSLA